jgi:geranylgeranyl transferase type-2 subunit beta
LNSLHLLGHPDALDRDEVVEFVLSCQHDNGGFGAAPGHDAHLLYTVSAVQVLVLCDAMAILEERGKGDRSPLPGSNGRESGKLGVGRYLAGLQNRETGTFAGDEWGEEDTRFLYAGMLALSLLETLHLVNVDKAVDYIVSCANFDGGYGASPGAESHAMQILVCVAALSVLGRLDAVSDIEKLGRWLSERQVDGGGLNGRPEKLEDVCYSWWVAASLKIIGKLHWIDESKLARYILECQVSSITCTKRKNRTRGQIMLIRIPARTQSRAALQIDQGIWWMSSTPNLALPD